MTFYEKELMTIFGDSEVLSADTVSSGKMLISKIGKDIRAKIYFTTTSVADNYDALMVKIINRRDGVIDEQRFNFGELLGIKNEVAPHIWQCSINKIDWYRYKPTDSDYEKIQSAVEGYIEMFADEDMYMDIGGQSMGGM